ncbi:BURP domain-containing protein 3 [Acorus calamus]|uniref:BURP domain-containing protein 3 n=1 Tax=Acorus calamus TaxID=4465 RepID=A0AAV9CQ35_ACOCL|nr:BURP domain-containing protein 3 [Acorus calamus]
MDRLSIPSLLLLLALVSVTQAALPPQEYWNRVLPNTPMPKAVTDLLRGDAVYQKSDTSVDVGKGGVHVDAGKGTTVDVGHGGVGVDVGHGGTNVGVGNGGVHVDTGHKGQPSGGTSVDENHGGVGVGVDVGHGGKGGVGVDVGHGGKGGVGVGVGVHGHYSPFIYNYAATEDQLHDDPNVALFFREEALRRGTHINLHFTTTGTTGTALLPRRTAESLPFSSAKLPEILSRLSVDPNSEQAAEMKTTLRECEDPAAEGEDKHCATSLESMVDFTTSELGTTRVVAVSTTVNTEAATETPAQEYTITSAKELAGPKTVTCHAQPYAYAVFYCHATGTAKAYVVQLKGKDGMTMVKAVAVCHTDTSGWNPKHLAFRVLNVKPGTVPVCHFLPQDHIVWTKSN